jgi:acetyl esterase/lipase
LGEGKSIMPEPMILDLKDSEGRRLRHKYLRQEGEARGLFFQLPGDNYGADGPLLYLPSRMLFSNGWDTFSMSYGYQSAGGPFSSAYIPAIVEECAAALEIVLAQYSYDKITMAGKSLGAAIIAVLLTMDQGLDRVRAVYLTPPLGTPVFDPVFIETQNASFLALGTADRFYDQKAFSELSQKKGFEYTLIPGADHSLYIEGDLRATLDAHARVTEAVIEFAEG